MNSIYFWYKFFFWFFLIGPNELEPFGYEKTGVTCHLEKQCKCAIKVGGCESDSCVANGKDGKCIGTLIYLTELIMNVFIAIYE